MLGMKKPKTIPKGPFEEQWRRWHPHDDEPSEVAEWGEQNREFIFEQMMKIYNNTPKDQPLPGIGNPKNFDSTIAIWVTMVIAMIIVIAAQAFLR